MNQYQIVVSRGDDRLLDLADLADVYAFDVAGATVRFTVDGLFTREVVVDESAGDITFELLSADTEDCPDRRAEYRYEIEAEEAGGEIRTIRRGRFVVVADLARVD